MVLAISGALAVPSLSAGASGAGTSQEPLLLSRVPNSPLVYVVTAGACESASCLHLFRTTTSARTFTSEALPPTAPSSGNVTGTLSHLVFASATVGFAVLDSSGVPRLFATHDGARSWHRWKLSVPGIVESVAVTSNTLYLEMADCAVTVPYCDNFRVARTPVSAPRWTSSPIPESRASARGTLFGPLAASGTSVWVTETGTRAYLARSHDGGHRFALVGSPQLMSVTGCALSATTPRDLWAQCSTGMDEVLWFSANDGTSWTYLDTPRPISGTGGGFFDPVAGSLAFLAGGASSSTLLRVSDAARHVVPVGRLVCPSLLGLSFSDAVHGLAVCSSYSTSYLEATSTGGATWTQIAIRATP
jgi:hypothetical protein